MREMPLDKKTEEGATQLFLANHVLPLAPINCRDTEELR